MGWLNILLLLLGLICVGGQFEGGLLGLLLGLQQQPDPGRDVITALLNASKGPLSQALQSNGIDNSTTGLVLQGINSIFSPRAEGQPEPATETQSCVGGRCCEKILVAPTTRLCCGNIPNFSSRLCCRNSAGVSLPVPSGFICCDGVSILESAFHCCTGPDRKSHGRPRILGPCPIV